MISFVLRILVHVLAILPDYATEFLAGFIARISATLNSKRLGLMRINVDKILGLPPHTSFARTFYRQVFASQVRCFIDTCREVVFPRSVVLDGFHDWQTLVEKFESQGRPIIFAAAHIGSWEITGNVIARTSMPWQSHQKSRARRLPWNGSAAAWGCRSCGATKNHCFATC